jgi:hypothetical protein
MTIATLIGANVPPVLATRAKYMPRIEALTIFATQKIFG